MLSPAMIDAVAKDDPVVNKAWSVIKGKLEFVAGYGTLADDAAKLAKLVAALGGAGRAYVKHYKGKNYIILKSFPGLRKNLTATRYLVDNTKVVALGLGRHAAQAAARQGGVLTIYFMGAYRVADYFLRDDATLAQLVGSLAVDVVKVGIAVGVSLVGAAAAAAFGIAIGPIAAVVVFGGAAAVGLNALDKRFGITDKVVVALEEISQGVASKAGEQKNKLVSAAVDVAAELSRPVIAYVAKAAREVVIDATRHSLERFLNPRF